MRNPFAKSPCSFIKFTAFVRVRYNTRGDNAIAVARIAGKDEAMDDGDLDDESWGYDDGFCQACGAYGCVNDIALCQECAGMLRGTKSREGRREGAELVLLREAPYLVPKGGRLLWEDRIPLPLNVCFEKDIRARSRWTSINGCKALFLL
jgi:hypothetical protein